MREAEIMVTMPRVPRIMTADNRVAEFLHSLRRDQVAPAVPMNRKKDTLAQSFVCFCR